MNLAGVSLGLEGSLGNFTSDEDANDAST